MLYKIKNKEPLLLGNKPSFKNTCKEQEILDFLLVIQSLARPTNGDTLTRWGRYYTCR